MKAILLAIETFIKTKNRKTKTMLGNTTAISCANKIWSSYSMDCCYQDIVRILGVSGFSCQDIGVGF